MKRRDMVKKEQDFDRIIKSNKLKKNKYFVIYYEKNNSHYDKYGISVGKKIGKAYLRNRYKRKIRAIIDEYKKDYQNGTNYIIILRKNGLDLNYQELKRSFFELMKDQKGEQK